MNNWIPAVFLILFLLAMPAGNYLKAQELTKDFKIMELKQSVEDLQVKSDKYPALEVLSPSKEKEKSPYLGALFSGIIPGSGEFYAKSYVKAAVFFAIEAGLWTMYFVNDGKGDDQTEKFQNFADANWSINRYAQWLVEQQFNGYTAITDYNNSNKEELRQQVNIVEQQNFSHQLPAFGSQQYYELIGKYQNFVAGWSDADISNLSKNPGSPNYYGTYKTPMYTDYAADRQQANDYYDMASTSTTLVIFNHLLSAADAAWSVSMFNKDIRVKSSVRLKSALTPDYRKITVPTANFAITF